MTDDTFGDAFDIAYEPAETTDAATGGTLDGAVGDEAVDPGQLASRVAAAAKRNPQTEVQLRADRAVPYGRVAELIGVVQKAGLTRIGFVAEPETK